MNCLECKELLVAYVEGLLAEQQKQAVQSHLTACPSCRAEESDLKSLRDRLATNGRIFAQSRLEDKVLNRIIREQNLKLKNISRLNNQINIWRNIMKSRITKLAAAAVIIIAVVLGLNIIGGPDIATVAWGQVLEAMEKIPTVVFDMTNTTILGENKTMSTKSKVYDAGEHGIREDMYMNGELVLQKYMVPKEGVIYFIRRDERNYYTHRVLTNDLAEIEEASPRQWVKNILSEDYTELGQSNINGIEVEGVEVQNSKLLGGDEGSIRLWVDIKTNLPVRMELKGMMMESGAKRPMTFVMDAFQWDVKLDASIFEPNIPADYTLFDRR